MVQRPWSAPTRYGLWILPPAHPCGGGRGLTYFCLTYPGPPSSRVTGPYTEMYFYLYRCFM